MPVDLPPRPEPPLPIGISQCLLGDEVRYDGSGARSSFPHAALTGLFAYESFCPEVGIGMTVPRDPIRLVGTVDDYRVKESDEDYFKVAQRNYYDLSRFIHWIYAGGLENKNFIHQVARPIAVVASALVAGLVLLILTIVGLAATLSTESEASSTRGAGKIGLPYSRARACRSGSTT